MIRTVLRAGVLLGVLGMAVGPLPAQSWQSYTANNNFGAGGEYWDNVSADGPSCNAGFIASKTSGACANQANPGWLPYTGPAMAHNLRNGQGFTPFLFAAGTYRFRQGAGVGGQVAALDQMFGYFTRTEGGAPVRTALPNSNAFDITVTFTTSWGLFIDEVGPGISYSDDANSPFFALFGSRATALGTSGGVTTVLAVAGDDFLAGFADVTDGDRDYNDEILSISAVPEPSTYVLLATGLAALASLSRRRRAM